MQGVPDVPLQATSAGLRAEDNPHCLALRSLGLGHGRTIQDGPQWHDSLACCRGQVHQVDRGKTNQKSIADITTRYNIPHNIITDNDTNFAKGALARFCATQGISLDLASIAHPQSNGQVGRANGLILSGLKPRLVEPLEHSAATGSTSSRPSSRACAQLRTSQLASRLSSSSTVPKPSSRRT